MSRADVWAGLVLASVPCWSLEMAVWMAIVLVSALLLYGLYLAARRGGGL